MPELRVFCNSAPRSANRNMIIYKMRGGGVPIRQVDDGCRVRYGGKIRAIRCFFAAGCRSGESNVNCCSTYRVVGAWLSLARAPGSGPGGRWFKSTRPDHSSCRAPVSRIGHVAHSLQTSQRMRHPAIVHHSVPAWRCVLAFSRGLNGRGTLPKWNEWATRPPPFSALELTKSLRSSRRRDLARGVHGSSPATG